MKPKDILNLKFYSNDLSEEVTIKRYLKKLLSTLWIEKDEFSGKRPLGNSDWEYEIYKCLVENNVIVGIIEDGCLENFNIKLANSLILDAIAYMCK